MKNLNTLTLCIQILRVAQNDTVLKGGFNHEVWHYSNMDDMKFAYTISDTLYAYDHKANRLKADFVMKNHRKTDDIYCTYTPMPGKYVTWVKIG